MTTSKPRAGNGAKAKILTKMIYPRQPVDNPKHESIVVLVAEEEKEINSRKQLCYTFQADDGDGDICYAIKRYVHVFEEGDEAELFDTNLSGTDQQTRQPQKKGKQESWKKSKAKQRLYELLMDGVIPIDNNNTMTFEEMYLLDEEFGKFEYKQFKGRVNRMRAKIQELDSRSTADLEAFRNFKRNHKPSLFSHKGYIQWQGSTAQEFLWDDIDAYLKDPTKKPKDLWLSRKEYRDEFPLDAFRDKIKQEIRTAKYIRTRDARARGDKT